MAERAVPLDGGVVLIDGGCGFCQRCRRWVERRAPSGRFVFHPLTSEDGRAWLRHVGWTGDAPDALVFVEAERWAMASTAALRVAVRMGWPWRLFGVFLVVPRPMRDWVYRLVARERHRLPGPARHG